MKESEQWEPAAWQRSTHRQFWKNMSANRHVLQIYDSDQVLLVALNGFARTAVACDEPLILVATPRHLSSLSKSLRLFGLDTDQLRLGKRLVFADASDTLGRFMRDGKPDASLFYATLHDLVSAVSSTTGKATKIFGEMVAILWENGEHDATFELEEMWTRACEKKNLHLFCAYPRSLFIDSLHGKLVHICQQHATAVSGTSSSYTELKYRALG